MVVIFYHFHEAVLAILNRVLLARPATYFSWKLLIASAVNAGIAVLLFPVLDHLRKPS
jgi:hypothetical protein